MSSFFRRFLSEPERSDVRSVRNSTCEPKARFSKKSRCISQLAGAPGGVVRIFENLGTVTLRAWRCAMKTADNETPVEDNEEVEDPEAPAWNQWVHLVLSVKPTGCADTLLAPFE